MNRLNHTPVRRRRIRPRTTVLGGTALGLIAGAAVFGIVSSGAPAASTRAPFKPALVSAAVPAAAVAAPCARDQKLERGVCIVHVRRTIVVASAAVRSAAATSPAVTSPAVRSPAVRSPAVASPGSGPRLVSGSPAGSGASATGEHAAEGDGSQGAAHEQDPAVPAGNAGEQSTDAAAQSAGHDG